jgi:hypothetical protein
MVTVENGLNVAISTAETATAGRDDCAGDARHVSLSKGGGAAHLFIFSRLQTGASAA